MCRITLRQLKYLRSFRVPPEALENGRRRLLIVMADSPMTGRRSLLRAYIWKPAMAAVVVIIFVAVSGGGVAYAAQAALPGEALYTVKLALESAREHLALSSERRFALQADHAARRLDETERIIQNPRLAAADRAERVQSTMAAYQARVGTMDRAAAKLTPDAAKPERGRRTVEAVERILDRHVDLVASASSAAPDIAESLDASIDDSVRLESDVYAMMHAPASDDAGQEASATTTGRGWRWHLLQAPRNISLQLRRGKLWKPVGIKAER